MWDIRLFCRDKMGLSDTALGHLPWPELLQRLVSVQRNVRLSLRGDLSQHDIVMRIMRKDDYLIGAISDDSGAFCICVFRSGDAAYVGKGKRHMPTTYLIYIISMG